MYTIYTTCSERKNPALIYITNVLQFIYNTDSYNFKFTTKDIV